MKRTEFFALKDIVQAMNEIAAVIDGVDRETYERDFRVHRIVERCVEIVSEASRRISAESKRSHPDVPWHAIEAIGNKLRHEYRRVDPDIMWSVATRALPQLRPVVEALLKQAGG